MQWLLSFENILRKLKYYLKLKEIPDLNLGVLDLTSQDDYILDEAAGA